MPAASDPVLSAGSGDSASALAAASELLGDELQGFERALEHALAPQRPYLTELELALCCGGKRLRPMLLLLSHRAAQPAAERRRPVAEKALGAAAALELLHTATLIHDDIADGARTRRGRTSVHAARGVGTALVVGDMQLVQALRCFAGAVDSEADMALVRTVLDAGFRLCCGQLDELAWEPPGDLSELRARSLQITDRKTATLFELACGTGATLAGRGLDAVWMLSRFGRLYGRALQLMDDLGDLLEPDVEGLAGSDLLQGRPSLPLLLALEELGPASATAAVFHGQHEEAAIAAARREIVGSAAFLEAYAESRRLALGALQTLEGIAASSYRDALQALTRELVDRGLDGSWATQEEAAA